jgi:hypothetical protein
MLMSVRCCNELNHDTSCPIPVLLTYIGQLPLFFGNINCHSCMDCPCGESLLASMPQKTGPRQLD